MSDLAASPPSDPLELLRQRSYVVLLVFGALIGVPVAVVAALFMQVVGDTQSWLFTSLPDALGFDPQAATRTVKDMRRAHEI